MLISRSYKFYLLELRAVNLQSRLMYLLHSYNEEEQKDEERETRTKMMKTEKNNRRKVESGRR
jgi:hypothetical protein